MPLAQDVNTLDFAADTETATIAAPVVATPQPAVVASPSRFSSNLNSLTHYFLREMGCYTLPADATTNVTIINGGMRCGTNMEKDFGDYLDIEPINYTPYQKVNLGLQNPTEEEKRLQVSCFNGETVEFDGVTYSKGEYLELLRTKGYSQAAFRDHGILHAMYVGSERDEKIGLTEDEHLLTIYLSKSSNQSYQAFLMRAALSRGNVERIRLTKETCVYKNNSWVRFKFARLAKTVEQN